jgi:hypothetical protein
MGNNVGRGDKVRCSKSMCSCFSGKPKSIKPSNSPEHRPHNRNNSSSASLELKASKRLQDISLRSGDGIEKAGISGKKTTTHHHNKSEIPFGARRTSKQKLAPIKQIYEKVLSHLS